jgi:spore coat polysaccharide biosynthesis protein SpsF
MSSHHLIPHKEHRCLTIIQARMSSSRLPGKVLRDIAGQAMLSRVVLRARRARMVSQVVVATTTDPSDDPVFAFCRQQGYPVFRGSLNDVLDRYYQAAREFGAEIAEQDFPVVRVTADCPVIDPGEIDHVVNEFLADAAREVPGEQDLRPRVDFAANRLPPPWKRTYPIGLDTEVCWFTGLERAWREARLTYEREHVMPYFYDEPDRFRIRLVDYPQDYGHLRWTVDTAEDLELINRVYTHFYGRNDFTWLEVLDLFERQPDLMNVNAGIHHKHLHEK